MKTTLAALVAIAVGWMLWIAASPAPAAFGDTIYLTQSSSQLVGTNPPGLVCDNLSFQKFRSSLGTLDQVRIGFEEAGVRTRRRIENRTPTGGCMYSAGVYLNNTPGTPASLDVVLFDGSTELIRIAPSSVNVWPHSLDVYDGVEDFDGASGQEWDHFPIQYDWGAEDVILTGDAMEPWIGNGTRTLQVCSQYPVYGTFEHTCAQVTLMFDNWAYGKVFVEYTYH